jgi:hypothetical protein
MEYRVKIVRYGRSAKNRGIISGRWTEYMDTAEVQCFTISASNDDSAYRRICELFAPTDPRPLAGKSYLRACRIKPRKLGDRVRLIHPYAAMPGVFCGYSEGTVTEVVSDRIVSVGFPGYHTQFVDFGLAELY